MAIADARLSKIGYDIECNLCLNVLFVIFYKWIDIR